VDLGDPRRTVLLAGTGRSGTTWVEDIINAQGDYRILFEPFHSRKVPELREWSYRQYLRPDERAEKYLAPAHRILSGQLRNAWVDQFNARHVVRRRLAKNIRANRLLGWIRRNFPEIPIVLLLRHPCAVASSKLEAQWDTHLSDFLDQEALVEDHLRPFVAKMRGARDDFERHVFLWCVENRVPLRQFARSEIHVCFYEHFCVDLETEARALFAYLGRALDPELLEAARRPSAMARPRSAVRSGGDLIDGWRQRITAGQVRRAAEILELFGLHGIYGESSMPLVTAREDALSGAVSVGAACSPALAARALPSDSPARP
jgi:hypothetical protein